VASSGWIRRTIPPQVSQLDAFLRWCHPDLLTERLRHSAACWQLLQALELDPEHCPPPQAGSVSLISWCGQQLALTSAVQLDAQGRPPSFPLLADSVSLWVLALLEPQASSPLDPLNRQQWRFWLVPARRLHPERRSIALQPLMRAHGEGLAWDALAGALAAEAQR
jgi:hypothetical protein